MSKDPLLSKMFFDLVVIPTLLLAFGVGLVIALYFAVYLAWNMTVL